MEYVSYSIWMTAHLSPEVHKQDTSNTSVNSGNCSNSVAQQREEKKPPWNASNKTVILNYLKIKQNQKKKGKKTQTQPTKKLNQKT